MNTASNIMDENIEALLLDLGTLARAVGILETLHPQNSDGAERYFVLLCIQELKTNIHFVSEVFHERLHEIQKSRETKTPPRFEAVRLYRRPAGEEPL